MKDILKLFLIFFLLFIIYLNLPKEEVDAIGEIKIKEASISSFIVEDATKENLDKNIVTHIKESSLDTSSTILLAGHNDTVFKNLYKVKKGMEISLKINGKETTYLVLYNLEIKEDDYRFFKEEKNKLILLTCSENNKRRIVIASVK